MTGPVGALFGPIFQKDVRTAGRRRSTYILRGLFVAALLGFISVAFYGFAESPETSAVERLQRLQQIAPGLAIVVIWFQFAALSLVAPILASPGVCDERRARTLSCLLTTPLNATQILLSKLSSRLVQVIILSLLTAPILLAMRVFGGLDAAVVGGALALTISSAVLGAALALMYSMWHQRATAAAVFALLTLGLLQVGPSAIEGVIYFVRNVWLAPVGTAEELHPYHQKILTTFSPFALVEISETIATGRELPWLEINSPFLAGVAGRLGLHSLVIPPSGVRVAPSWVIASLYNLLLAAGVVFGSVIIFRRLLTREAFADGGNAVQRRRWFRRRKRAAAIARSATTPQPETDGAITVAAPVAEALRDDSEGREIRERRASRVVSDRPVLWREMRRSAIRSNRMRWSVAALAVGGVLLIYFTAGFDDEGVHSSFSVLLGLAVMLLPVFMTTGSIASEREARTWETLLTTPLTALEVVAGKFVGALRGLWFLPTLLLAHMFLATVFGSLRWFYFLHVVIIALGPMLFFTATGLLYSLIFKRGVTAAVMNLCTALFLWLGLWVVMLLLGWWGGLADFDWFERAADAIVTINPVFMLITAGDPVIGMGQLSALKVDYRLATYHEVSFLSFSAIVLGSLLFYATLGAAALWLSAVLFRRASGRSS